MNVLKHFRSHIFFYLVALCIATTFFASFDRFMIRNDYFVYYENDCDPYTQSCFQSCEDECTYYSRVQKYAPDIYSQCGKDITDCESAKFCLPTDKECSVTFCNLKIDQDCEVITGIVNIEIDEQSNIEKPI